MPPRFTLPVPDASLLSLLLLDAVGGRVNGGLDDADAARLFCDMLLARLSVGECITESESLILVDVA